LLHASEIGSRQATSEIVIGGRSASSPSIAVDPGGNPGILWVDAASGTLRYSY
jgi:hypothetical protein